MSMGGLVVVLMIPHCWRVAPSVSVRTWREPLPSTRPCMGCMMSTLNYDFLLGPFVGAPKTPRNKSVAIQLLITMEYTTL